MKKILLLLILLSTNNLYAITYDYFGYVSQKITINNLRNDTLLNPNREIYDLSDYESLSSINLSSKLILSDKAKFILKARPSYSKQEIKQESKIFIDNAYIDINFKNGYFMSIGKENLIEGVGLSYNPSDFLNENKPIDYSKSEEDRKQDREGNYVIRTEWMNDKLTLNMVFAPHSSYFQDEPDRFQIKAYTLFKNIDMSLHYFRSDYNAMGFNMSKNISDKLVLNLEAGSRDKSFKRHLMKGNEIGFPSSGVFEYLVSNQENKGFYTRALAGASYTFENKLNLIMEYFYNQDGYTSDEWNEFINITKSNRDLFINSPYQFAKDISKSNLGLSNSLMKYRYMGQHYLFLRASYPDLMDRINIISGILLNVMDKSFVFMPSINYSIKKGFLDFELSSTILSGDKDSEFGLSPIGSYYSGEFRIYF